MPSHSSAFRPRGIAVLLVVIVKLRINHLTLQQYERRVTEAHRAQSVLRSIVAAARVAELELRQRDAKHGRAAEEPHRLTGYVSPVSKGQGVHSNGKDRWSRFFVQLDGMSGGLELGAGFDEAVSLDQVRQLAARIFGILKTQTKLLRTQRRAPRLIRIRATLRIPARQYLKSSLPSLVRQPAPRARQAEPTCMEPRVHGWR